jgi:hypothetical protein
MRRPSLSMVTSGIAPMVPQIRSSGTIQPKTLPGGAAAWPVVARQQVLGEQLAASGDHSSPPFLQSLSKTGFTDGRNVAIEYRWAGED